LAEIYENEYSGSLTYAAGENRDYAGGWMDYVLDKQKRPEFFFTDFSKYDGHISQALLAIISLIYKYLYNSKDCLNMLYTQFLTEGNVLCHEGSFYYKVFGTRKSGDPNTTVDNSFLNALMQLWCLSKQFDVWEALKTKRLLLMFMGDDTIIACDGFSVNKKYYDQCMKFLGMDVDSSYGDKYSAKFCSSAFVPCRRRDTREVVHVLTPLTGRILAGCGASIKKYTGKAIKDWCYTNAYAYCQDFCNLPWIAGFFEKIMVENPGKYKPVFNDRYWDGGFGGNQYKYDSCDETVDWWCVRYNFDNEDIKTLVQQLGYPKVDWNHHIFDSIFDVDLYGRVYHVVNFFKPLSVVDTLTKNPEPVGDVYIRNFALRLDNKDNNDVEATTTYKVNKPMPFICGSAKMIADHFGLKHNVYNNLRKTMGYSTWFSKNDKKYTYRDPKRRINDFVADRTI